MKIRLGQNPYNRPQSSHKETKIYLGKELPKKSFPPLTQTVASPNSPSSSKSWTENISHKFPVSVLIFFVLLGSIIAAGVYIKQMTGSVKVIAVNKDYASLEGVDFNQEDVLNISGGNSIVKTFLMRNNGSQRMNATMLFQVAPLKGGDCKIWLRDGTANTSDVIVDSSGLLDTTYTYIGIEPGSSKNGVFEIQCGLNVQNKTVSYVLSMSPGYEFQFK